MLPDPLHFDRICRICLSSSEKLINLFDFDEDILSLLISSNDNLPQHICAFCSHQMKTTHYFILKCQESDRKLRLSLPNSVEKSNDSTSLEDENLLNDVIEYDSVEDNSSSRAESIGNGLIISDELIENAPILQSDADQVIDESSVDTTRFMTNFCVDCNECQIEFVCPDTFAEHMKTHHTEDNFEYLEADVDETLPESSSQKNSCDICNKSFATPKSLERHKVKHENSKKTEFKCHVCGKQTKHINHFKIHIRCHKDLNEDINELIEGFFPEPKKIGNKKHVCSICQRTCSSRSNLAVHIRRHNGKMTNFCHICGKGYPRSTDLTVHIRQHTGEKPFVCLTCNRGFKRSDKLTIHMRIHTGERPYSCNICAKAFAQRNDLLIHQRRNVCSKNSSASKTEHHNAN